MTCDFFAFDSFEGLPDLEGIDSLTEDFKTGQYAATHEVFLNRVVAKGVPKERVVTVKGWFADTSNTETFERLELKKAQDGTVIIFDDWYAFKGNPNLGEQRAFREWKETVEGFTFTEYQKEGAWRNSFIACKIC